MEQLIQLEYSGLYLVIKITPEGDVLLLHLAPVPFHSHDILPHEENRFRLLEIQAAGFNQNDHHGNKHTGCNPGYELRYISHDIQDNNYGKCLSITMENADLRAVCTLQFFQGIPAVRSYAALTGLTEQGICLEYVSSFALTGLTKETGSNQANSYVSWAHNSWCSELQWRRNSLEELGIGQITDPAAIHNPDQYQDFSLNSIRIFSQGTWSTSEYLPIGALENPHYSMVWQIETNSPWQWEISTIAGHYYLQMSGPEDNLHHWHMNLGKGEKFTTVTASIAFSLNNREAAFAQMTRYRRCICRKVTDNTGLPIIYNEYMVSLGDPTQERLLPLIDSAATLGCEYFCIDAGWYADGNWWDSVGMWLPEKRRFPDGLSYVMNYIREKGMIPGIWLELEVMGIHCPLVKELPEECFFIRNGRRVIDHSRYQLDFRHPLVIKHADEVVDRLVKEYGVGYIKMDYNINGGFGTEAGCDSPGEGLLLHSRAYLDWLRRVFDRYPDLIIENCASGGMRMDYGLLSLLTIQSLSDQDEAVRLAKIAAASPTAVTPEQAACWSLPKPGETEETVIFSMVNTMLLRIHQSGDIPNLSEACRNLVREAFTTYQSYRRKIPEALPFWPLGLPSVNDDFLSLGLDLGDQLLLAVWNLKGEKGCLLPLPSVVSSVRQLYPTGYPCEYQLTQEGNALSVVLPPAPSARLFQLNR